MSDAEIVDQIFSLLIASLQSTAHLASFMCLMLAENPVVQERLRHEVYMHFGEFLISKKCWCCICLYDFYSSLIR
jgi:cytochrome P450